MAAMGTQFGIGEALTWVEAGEGSTAFRGEGLGLASSMCREGSRGMASNMISATYLVHLIY